VAFDWKALVRTVAPVLGTALGGPLGGMAARAVAGAVLGNEDAGEAEIAAALQGATPETLLALKKADQDFAVRMKELDIDVDALHQRDRDSARDREKTVGGYANPVLAAVILGGFFAVAAAVIAGHAGADPATATLVGAVVGYASAKADQVVAYYFGSSKGSKDKTDILSRALKP
jgi:hypothetical protein